MLSQHLNEAGYFPILWAPAEPGTTYVRPGARGVLRVFVPAHRAELELYAGPLVAGELRYCGPVPPEAELRLLLAGNFSALPHAYTRHRAAAEMAHAA